MTAARLEAVLAALATILVVAVPLAVHPERWVFPFVTTKVLVLRALVVAIAGVYVTLVAVDPARYRPRITPMSAAIALFAVSLGVSTAVGVDPRRSVYGTVERLAGGTTALTAIALYVSLAFGLRQRRHWRWVLRSLVGAVVVVVFVGAAQRVDPHLLANGGARRVISTLGHPGYLAGLSLVAVFLGPEVAKPHRWFGRLIAATGVAGVAISETRGTIIALGFAGALWAARCLWQTARRRMVRGVGWTALAVVGCIGGVGVARSTVDVSAWPFIGRFADVDLATGTVATRLLAWEVAIDAWRDRPWLGWGPTNFAHAFDLHYRPEFLSFGLDETYFDHPHNAGLDVLVTQGVVGVAAALTVAFVVIRELARRRDDRAGMVLFFTALAVHLSFLFVDIALLVTLVIVVAFASSRPTDAASERRLTASALVVPMAVVGLAWGAISPLERACRSARTAAASVVTVADDATVSFKAGLVDMSQPGGARLCLADVLFQSIPAYIEADRHAELRSHLVALDEAFAAANDDGVRAAGVRARIALVLDELFADGQRLRSALVRLESARAKSPRRQETEWLAELVAARLGT